MDDSKSLSCSTLYAFICPLLIDITISHRPLVLSLPSILQALQVHSQRFLNGILGDVVPEIAYVLLLLLQQLFYCWSSQLCLT